MKYKVFWYLCVGATLVFLGFAGFFLQKKFSSDLSPSKLKDAPSFRLKDSPGKDHRLEDFKGKWVFVHFWASWCVPCAREFPTLIEFASKVDPQKIQVIAISLDESWEKAQSILGKNQTLPPSLVVLLDATGEVAKNYGTFELPETYFLTRDLKIATKWIGAQDWLKVDPSHTELPD